MIKAYFSDGRVVSEDSDEARELYNQSRYGKVLENKTVQLSLYEALYLVEKKKLEVLGNLVKDHILLSKDNVVFTPHIGFYSQEALERILDTNVQNIQAFISGNPQNVI